jgi:hypothetical protein
MAGVEEEIINSHYLVIIVVSIMFTVISLFLLYKTGFKFRLEKTISNTLATMCWFISGIVHIAASPSSSPLFPLAYLWFAFGIVFFLLMIVDVFSTLRYKREGDVFRLD